jgi:uncharacterized protein (TIGR02118 family)
MVALVRRRPELTRAEFARHWAARHAPLARRHHVGVSVYVQHVVERAVTPGGAEVDGVAELGFPDREAFRDRYYDSDAGREAIAADVRRFIARPGPDTTLVGP